MTWETSDFANLKITDILFSHIHNPKKILNFYEGDVLQASYSVKDIHDEVQLKKKILKSSLQSNEMVFLSWGFDFEYVTLFLALLEIEVIPVPLLSDQNFSNERYITYLIEYKNKTGISKIVAPEKHKESLVSNGFEVVILKKEKDFFNSRNNPQMPRLIHSVGKQKNAFMHLGTIDFGFHAEAFIFSHQSILKSILKIKSELHLGEEQKILNVFSPKEDFFVFVGFLLPLIVGMEIHHFSFEKTQFNAAKWLALISTFRAEIWFGPAEFYKQLLDLKLEQAGEINLKCVKHCLCSANNLDPDLADHFNYEFKKKGLSEEAFKIFYSPIVNHFITGFTRQKVNIEKLNNKKIPSLGAPVKGNFYRIVDENNYVLGEDQEGFICIKSNTFVPTIYNFDSKSEQQLDEQTWYRTNDIGFLNKGELFRTGWDEHRIAFQKNLWTKSALKERIQKIFGAVSEVKDIEIQSLSGKRGQEEIYIILVMRFSLKWFGPFLKRKFINKLSDKLKIKKENIIFISERKMPLTLEGRLKPLTFKRQIIEKIKSKD